MKYSAPNAIQNLWHRASGSLQPVVRRVRRMLGLPVAPESDRQIIPPRVAILIIAVFSLTLGLGVISIGQAPVAIVADQMVALHTYQSTHLPYQLRYLPGWSVAVTKPSATGDSEQIVFRNGREIVKLAVAASEQQVSPLFPSLPTRALVDGHEALRYHDYDTATGQPLDRMAWSVGGLSYVMSGSGPVLDRFAASLRILP